MSVTRQDVMMSLMTRPEKGERLVELVVQRLATLIDQRLKRPTHPGRW